MTSLDMDPTRPHPPRVGAVMAAMMLPGAVPAIVRRARELDGVLAAALFAGAYLGTWALVALAIHILYRPPGAGTGGALMVGAGPYELTPIKLECRRRCRERVRSGLRFSVYCSRLIPPSTSPWLGRSSVALGVAVAAT